MPGIAGNNRHALEVTPSGPATRELAQDESNCDGDWNSPDRKEEEHGNEHELGRNREPGPDLELHLRRHGVRGEQQDHRDDRRAPRRFDQHREGDCGHEEAAADDQRGEPFRAGKRLRPPLAPFLDESVAFRIEVRRVAAVESVGGARYCHGHATDLSGVSRADLSAALDAMASLERGFAPVVTPKGDSWMPSYAHGK